MLFIALVLSQQAQSAEADQTKSPLTATEKAQCRVQLTEFNERVRTNNAAVDAVKALEAEIDALRAAIDKEQAAVDRRDSAAMNALDAKIARNNALVTQHDEMNASLKAMSSETRQRSAQFKEACENRPLASSPSPSPSPSPKPPSSDTACGSADGARGVERQIEGTFAELRADEKKHQTTVESAAKARAKSQGWNDERRGKIWMQILRSPKFMGFQREKQPYMDELMRILGSKPKNKQEECHLVQRIATMLPAIKSINAKQYAFMADEIRVAK